MNYTSVKNLVWMNIEKTIINCIVNFENLGEIPFAAMLDDFPNGDIIFKNCVDGMYGYISEYVEIVDVSEKPAFLKQPKSTGTQTL